MHACVSQEWLHVRWCIDIARGRITRQHQQQQQQQLPLCLTRSLPSDAGSCVSAHESDLTEPIDVYTDWIDECETVNAVEGAAEERKDDEAFLDDQELAEG